MIGSLINWLFVDLWRESKNNEIEVLDMVLREVQLNPVAHGHFQLSAIRDQMDSLIEMQLKVLVAMKIATQRGIIAWLQSDVDQAWYYTDGGPVQSHIHFKYPAYNGDVGSDRDFVDVGGVGRFMIGTSGWMLALEILAAGDEIWANHLAVMQEQMTRQLGLIEKAIAANSELDLSQSGSTKTSVDGGYEGEMKA